MTNQFAPFIPGDKGTFVVRNISNPNKTIRIFQHPILCGTERDLLQIPGVSEADIRAALLKGEIRNKILAREIIIVSSDVDLLSFNSLQKQFLKDSGVSKGTEITVLESVGFTAGNDDPSSSGDLGFVLRQNITPIGTKNGINRTFVTPDRFIDGTYNGHSLRLEVFHNGRKLVKNTDYNISESVVGLGYNIITFCSFAPGINSQILVNYSVRV